jgi:hypothetical protein
VKLAISSWQIFFFMQSVDLFVTLISLMHKGNKCALQVTAVLTYSLMIFFSFQIEALQDVSRSYEVLYFMVKDGLLARFKQVHIMMEIGMSLSTAFIVIL